MSITPTVTSCGLLAVSADESCICGYVLSIEGSVWDAEYGRLPGVTREQGVKHNAVLDKAIIDGLDACKVGEGHMFYVASPGKVTTFIGTPVGTCSPPDSRTFVRGDRRFQHTPRKGPYNQQVFVTRVA